MDKARNGARNGLVSSLESPLGKAEMLLEGPLGAGKTAFVRGLAADEQISTTQVGRILKKHGLTERDFKTVSMDGDTLRAATSWIKDAPDGRLPIKHGDSFVMFVEWPRGGPVRSPRRNGRRFTPSWCCSGFAGRPASASSRLS